MAICVDGYGVWAMLMAICSTRSRGSVAYACTEAVMRSDVQITLQKVNNAVVEHQPVLSIHPLKYVMELYLREWWLVEEVVSRP